MAEEENMTDEMSFRNGTSQPVPSSSVLPGQSGPSPSIGRTLYPNLHLGLFNIERRLGKGKFGSVYLAWHPQSRCKYALKVMMKKEIIEAGAKTPVQREIEVHSTLQHPSILGFHGWFYDSERIVLILEYAALGMLYSYLKEAGWFTEREASKYIVQVVQSLIYLHDRDIIHRDIKPENLLLTANDELKLADFGHSVHSPKNRRTTICGTPDYMPPEMFQPSTGHTKAVDQWALGVLTYELLTGQPPFGTKGSCDLSTRIINGDMRPFPAGWVSSEGRNFVASLLVVDPSKRLPLKDVLTHPWIVQNRVP
ncbi:serine/threonine-protein kinase [Xylaria sp. FL1042]|nr:serine/threonine-protein kinase [Xylaria sp. FL1042]